MDPLSIVAGVFGILSAATQLVKSLNELGSSIKDAGTDTTAAATELANITIVVQGLQTYVVGRIQASPQRLQMITIEHITATLTGCITTFSELDVVLKSMHVEGGPKAWDRAKWFLKKDRVNLLTQRLQNHKATFTMMLNILQCTSMSEAERNMDRLCDTVNEVLRTNQELCLRLRNIEDIQHTGRRPHEQTATQGALDPDFHSMRSSTSLSSMASTPSLVQDAKRVTGARPSTFEEQLHRSQVYRHAAGSRSQSSLVSDARSTLALSICSSLTLGDVSRISVYALPIYIDEISNASCYDIDEQEIASRMNVQYQTDLSPTSKQRAKEQRKGLSSWWKTRRQRPAIPESPEAAPKAVDGPGIFGIPLETSIRYANVAISLFNEEGGSYIFGYVPIIQAKCGVFLKEKGTEVPNIFLRGGSIKRIKELEAAFDAPPKYGKGLDWNGYTIHDCASILLRYYRQLPEPIIPLRLYERFREPFRGYQMDPTIDDPEEKRVIVTGTPKFSTQAATQTYQALVAQLHPLSRQSLLYLLDFLRVFISKSELNLMTYTKMATIFQPAILSHPDHHLSAVDLREARDIVIILLLVQDDLLGGEGDGDSQVTEVKTKDGASPPLLRRTHSVPSSQSRKASATTLARSRSITSRQSSSNGTDGAP